MSRATRDYNRRRAAKKLAALRLMLSRCDDRGFLQLAWATNILQSDLGSDVRRYLTYPKGAATSDMSAEFAVYKWDIETILALLLSTGKYAWRPHERRFEYRYDAFGNMATAYNLLHDAQNYEAGAYLEQGNLMVEMHRIGHKQFAWQRGFATSERLYRFAFIYGGEACRAYFKQAHGVSVDDVLKVGFVLFTQLHQQPWAKPVSLPKIGVDEALMLQVLPLLSLDLAQARAATVGLIAKMAGQGEQRTDYLPSVFRQYPVIRDSQNGAYIAPLPQLIMARVTEGLYYDLVGGPQVVMAEANNRFEQYAGKIIAAYYPRFQVFPSDRYVPKKGAAIDTPDVLVMDGGTICAVIECKATKLTFDAQFADDPMATAKRAYDQLVKGVAQIWRFFSHARRGIYAGKPVSPTAHGVLLTMDAWMQMAGELRTAVEQAARDLIKDDPDIGEEDMRPIVFCSMQDLADVMIVSTADNFLTTLSNSTKVEFFGWGLREVRRKAGDEIPREFPLDPGELLPWWGQFRRR